MKPRTISFDDGFFKEFKGEVLVVGVIMRGWETVERVVAGRITVDGDDATKTLAGLVQEAPQSLNAVFVDGIALGGFNLVDLNQLHQDTGLPVIAVTRKKPDLKSLHRALENVPNSQAKWEKIRENSPAVQHEKIYFHFKGITQEKAEELLDHTTKHSVPEGLRLAHLIASGITRSRLE